MPYISTKVGPNGISPSLSGLDPKGSNVTPALEQLGRTSEMFEERQSMMEQKQVEIHNMQWQLVREQMNDFSSVLIAFETEMRALKAAALRGMAEAEERQRQELVTLQERVHQRLDG